MPVVLAVALVVWVALPLTLVLLRHTQLAPILNRRFLGSEVSVWIMMAAIIGFFVWMALKTGPGD